MALDHPDGELDATTVELSLLASARPGALPFELYGGASHVGVDGTVIVPDAGVDQDVAHDGLHYRAGVAATPALAVLDAEFDHSTLLDASILWFAAGVQFQPAPAPRAPVAGSGAGRPMAGAPQGRNALLWGRPCPSMSATRTSGTAPAQPGTAPRRTRCAPAPSRGGRRGVAPFARGRGKP